MTPKQEQALRDYLQEAIVPLIEQVLVKKLGQAMTFAAQEVVSPKRTWVGLTDEERIKCRSYDPEEAVAKTEAKLKEKNDDPTHQ
jgi:hypothetical protein